MFKLLYDFLRWFPLAVFGAVVALATAFQPVAVWLAAHFPIWLHGMSEPLVGFVVPAALVGYVALLLWTGRHASHDRPRLRGRIVNIIHGGEAPGRDIRALMLEVEIANIGTMPSTASLADWRLTIKPRGKRHVPVGLMIPETPIHLGVGEHMVTYTPEGTIYAKMREPLAVGDSETGFAFTPVTAEQTRCYSLERRYASTTQMCWGTTTASSTNGWMLVVPTAPDFHWREV